MVKKNFLHVLINPTIKSSPHILKWENKMATGFKKKKKVVAANNLPSAQHE